MYSLALDLNYHSFPTRRSSDLDTATYVNLGVYHLQSGDSAAAAESPDWRDRKSTRLNSSHITISYAVFCLKNKNRDSLLHSPAAVVASRTATVEAALLPTPFLF